MPALQKQTRCQVRPSRSAGRPTRRYIGNDTSPGAHEGQFASGRRVGGDDLAVFLQVRPLAVPGGSVAAAVDPLSCVEDLTRVRARGLRREIAAVPRREMASAVSCRLTRAKIHALIQPSSFEFNSRSLHPPKVGKLRAHQSSTKLPSVIAVPPQVNVCDAGVDFL